MFSRDSEGKECSNSVLHVAVSGSTGAPERVDDCDRIADAVITSNEPELAKILFYHSIYCNIDQDLSFFLSISFFLSFYVYNI